MRRGKNTNLNTAARAAAPPTVDRHATAVQLDTHAWGPSHHGRLDRRNVKNGKPIT